MKYLITTTLFVILLFNLGFSQEKYTIKCQIAGWPTEKAYLVRQGNFPGVDSVAVTNGTFQFQGVIEGPTSAYLITQKRGGVAKLLYVEPGIININGTFEDLKNVSVKGSKCYDDYLELKNVQEKYDNEMGKYVQLQLSTNDSTTLKGYYQKLDSLSELSINFSREFIKKHPKSLISLLELNSLNTSLTNAEIKNLYDALDPTVKAWPEGKVLAGNLMYMGKDKVKENNSTESN